MTIVVETSDVVAKALSLLGIGDFRKLEFPERMAWIVLVLRELEDRPEWFPRGKWATIQHIEAQLLMCAKVQAQRIEGR